MTTYSQSVLVCLVATASVTQFAIGQELGMFPAGGYFTHCRALQTQSFQGGDDDHVNIWYFVVDPAIAGGTPAPDFYIHLFDGDHHAVNSTTAGTIDIDPYSQASASVFEYRLYGGPGAAVDDEGLPGTDPLSYAGTLIDIDGDPGDTTLRTDDPDDNDDNSPEDLRDAGYTTIAVDMDANPGDVVGGRHVYKFVVDGSFGPGGEWNRYRILGTRDIARTDPTGVLLQVYELAIASRPTVGSVWMHLPFRVPATSNGLIDLQTLDLDRQLYSARSKLWTVNGVVDDTLTFESGDQFAGSVWRWS